MSLKMKPSLQTFLLVSAVALASTASFSQENDDERQLNQIRDQEITQLKIVLGRREGANRRPDILLRLAELYIEKYRYYFLKENENHQRLIKEGRAPRYVEHSRSQAYLNSATHACLAILQSRVPFEKMDQVYYFLGYNAGELGKSKEALKYYTIVVDRYPTSSYASEAERNLAEAAFDHAQYRDAVKWYERASQHKDLKSYPRLLYKLSWAYFKVKRYHDALELMKRVIDLSGEESKFVGLRDEALNDIVGFYSEAGKYKDAKEYFESIRGGAELYVQALKRLSNVYERNGRFAQAIYVNQELIHSYEDSHPELTFEVMAQNVEVYRKAGDGAGEEKALTKLVDFFEKKGSGLKKGSDETKHAWDRTKKYLRARATEVHKEAQKKTQAALFSRAADLYGLYARAFLTDDDGHDAKKELSEIRVYRADSLLHAGKTGEAKIELRKILSSEGDLKNRREAGLTLLNLEIKAIDTSKQVNASEFFEDSKAFTESFPQDPIIAELEFKRAKLEIDNSSDRKMALEKYFELIEKYPSRSESRDAAKELVYSVVKAGDLDEGVKRANRFLANTALMAGDHKQELKSFFNSILARKSFGDVQSLEKSNNFADAAKNYESLAASTSDKEVARKSIHNAAVSYEKASQLSDALRLYERLLRSSNTQGEKDSYKAAIKNLASKLLWDSQFSQAAELYERFLSFSEFSAREKSNFGLLTFQLFDGIEAKEKAVSFGRKLLSSYCQQSDWKSVCEEVVARCAAISRESGATQDEVDFLKNPLISGSSSSLQLAQTYEASGDMRKAVQYYETAAHNKSRQRAELNASAHAAFLLVEPLYRRFSALRIEGSDAQVKARTKERIALVENLVNRYNAVVSMGDGEWGIAALERLGSALVSFAAELEAAPIPSGIKDNKEQREQYFRSLHGFTDPLRQRGFDFLTKAQKKGIELRVFSPVYLRVTMTLWKLSPRNYPLAHYRLDDDTGGHKRNLLRLMGATSSEDQSAWRRSLSTRLSAHPKAAELWVEFGNLEALSGRHKLARLLYGQALQLNPKMQAALNNRAVVHFLEGRPIEGVNDFYVAVEHGEFNKEPRLNLSKALLAYHHFTSAIEQTKILATRFSTDPEVQELHALALLGTTQASLAYSKFQSLDWSSSSQFSTWYNGAIAAFIAGGEKEREKARDKMEDHLSEKSDQDMIQAAFDVFKGKQGGGRE